MKRSVFVLAGAAAIVAGSVWPRSSRARKPAPAPMGFFVTSVGHWRRRPISAVSRAPMPTARSSPLRRVKPGAGDRVWRAYLSTQGPNAVNARDRIGSGPWANARGGIVARDVAHLHGDTVELAQLGSNLTKTTALTEKSDAGAWSGRHGPGWKAAEPARHPDGLDVGGTRVPGR